ncbi:ABC transporter permease [Sinosporangium siamense]|uniref:Uncharacterized protein n=1 Tax=Sinosporangium siamense TaxID=1367973 RepID=A0A919RIA4_9ACTN|nr:ABC transporter permease [Sinosporangium siamense]GII94333.1 hypothetical protein Ssi02_45640 [Sinosporangium siamense]
MRLNAWFLPVVAAGVAALAWGGVAEQVDWRALHWGHTSGQFARQLVLPGILTAAAASHLAARLTPRTRVFAQPWSVRAGSPVVLRHLGQLLGWFVPAYLLGLAPLVWSTAQRNAFGSPDLLLAAGAVVGLSAFVALGYLIGVLTQNLLAVPLTVTTVFLVAGLPHLDDAWNAVVPTMPQVPRLGREQPAGLSLYRLSAAVVFCLVFGWLAARMLRGRRRPAPVHGLLVIPVAMVVFPLLRPLEAVTALPGRQVCESHGGVTYCVHEGHRAELAPIRDAAAPIFAALGPHVTGVRQVRDMALALPPAQAGTVRLTVAPGWDPAEEVPGEVANTMLSRLSRCAFASFSIGDGATVDERRAYVISEFGHWLRSRSAGLAVPSGGLFERARPEQVRRWVTERRAEIAACTVDPEELPWR